MNRNLPNKEWAKALQINRTVHVRGEMKRNTKKARTVEQEGRC